MSIPTAFRTALNTLASWVDKNIDRKRTKVFIRTFEPSQWSNQSRTFCNQTKYPIQEPVGRDQSIFSDIIIETAHLMTEPITVLNITPMSAFRSDAHVGSGSISHMRPIAATGASLESRICGTKFCYLT